MQASFGLAKRLNDIVKCNGGITGIKYVVVKALGRVVNRIFGIIQKARQQRTIQGLEKKNTASL